ncbi:hypothetical protein BGW39_002203 [Mortierella sp. 14UC]|nr:hypothetical protein BGW39_002203 [Mortierella sp. 14UC]
MSEAAFATAAQELYTVFRDAEHAWIHNQSTSGTSNSNNNQDQAALEDSSLHYGEFAFLLAGLKPCLLLQLPTPAMTRDFFHQVLAPLVMQHPTYKTLSNNTNPSETTGGTTTGALGLECRLITRNVQTPEMSLKGYVLFWSSTTVDSHPQAASIQRSIDLLCPSSSAATITTTTMISDEDLALMLDIPGRLPTTEPEMRAMIEVSYWHQDNNNSNPANPSSPVLLTAFAAQPDQAPAIQTHFKRYRDTVRTLFNVTLKLHIQAMADL